MKLLRLLTLLWLACATLLLAAARPVANVPLPWARSTAARSAGRTRCQLGSP